MDSVECDLNDLEEKLSVDREENSQRLWLSFQNAANAVAQLFKGSGKNRSLKYTIWELISR